LPPVGKLLKNYTSSRSGIFVQACHYQYDFELSLILFFIQYGNFIFPFGHKKKKKHEI